MEATEDQEQLLNSEVANIIRLLHTQIDFLNTNYSERHKIKTLWVRAAISSLQGYLNTDKPPKRWNTSVK